METLSIEEIGYLGEIRQRLGLNENDPRRDTEIEQMSPMRRVRIIAGWYLGDPAWADEFKQYFESQGLYLTSNRLADGVIE